MWQRLGSLKIPWDVAVLGKVVRNREHLHILEQMLIDSLYASKRCIRLLQDLR
jgi:hypothetical protein